MWVKICGLTSPTEVRSLFEQLGHSLPDAVGLNFYSKSKRFVTPQAAAQIVNNLPASVTPIGLFVNETAEEIERVCSIAQITHVQLHGDETPDLIKQLRGLNVLKALRVGSEGLSSTSSYIESCNSVGIHLPHLLVDAMVDGEYGGTGHTAPWARLRSEWHPDWPRLILAGGLTPENVAAAIRESNAQGVDVASGVEKSPGIQDPGKVLRFIQQARAAFS